MEPREIKALRAEAAKHRAQHIVASAATTGVGIAMVVSGLVVLLAAISNYEQPYSFITCAQGIAQAGPGDLDMKTSPRPRPRPDDLTP